MTQGAIDLAQAELFTPVESSTLLLQSKACQGPQLLATQPAVIQKPLLQPLANYTWWDSNTHICISIPISAKVSPQKLRREQVQCIVQQQQLHCTITANKARQYRLSIPHLHACVQPGQSTCLLDGQTVLLTRNTSSPFPTGSPTHLAAVQSAEESTPRPLLQHCTSLPQSSTTTQKTFSRTHSQQAPSASLIPSSTTHLQPLASQPAAAAPGVSHVLIKLSKVDPSQHWETLANPSAPRQPCKPAPPCEQSMAALRRTLIHQRQQMQAQQGTTAVCTPAPPPLPAEPHLPAAAPLPAVAPISQQAEDVQEHAEAAVAFDDKLLQAFNLEAAAGSGIPGVPGSAHSSIAILGTDCKGAGPRILSHIAKVGRCQLQCKANKHWHPATAPVLAAF